MKKSLLYLILAILLLENVVALETKIDLSEAFQIVGKAFNDILRNDYATFSLTMIGLYILFYAIYVSAIGKIRIFEGAGGTGASTQGKMVAGTLSLLSVVGIGYLSFQKGVSVSQFLEQTLGPNRVLAGVIAAILIFLMIRNSFEDKKNAWVVAGLTTFILGWLLRIPIMIGAGLLIGIIALLSKVGGWSSFGRGYSQYQQEQRIERGLQREVGQERQEEQQEEQAEQQLEREEQVDNRLIQQLRNEIGRQRLIITNLHDQVERLSQQQGRMR